MYGYCSQCKQECRVGLDDQSFCHAFGTEEVYITESECCGAQCFHDEALSEPVTGSEVEEYENNRWYDSWLP
jgi:hypothetical protein